MDDVAETLKSYDEITRIPSFGNIPFTEYFFGKGFMASEAWSEPIWTAITEVKLGNASIANDAAIPMQAFRQICEYLFKRHSRKLDPEQLKEVVDKFLVPLMLVGG